MNDIPKLSLVIPSFHAAQHLRDLPRKLSIESHLMTNYIQVIIIDSESSDDSRQELRKLNEMFPAVITHSIGERLSPGQARNLGLELTTSDYVAFLDVDDEYNINGYVDLMHEMTANNYDIGVGAFQICTISHGDKSLPKTVSFRNGPMDLETVLQSNIGLWRCIFRRDWLTDNQVVFSDLLLGEDLLFLIDASSIDSSIIFSDAVLYTYFVGWPSQASSPVGSKSARVELLQQLAQRSNATKRESRENQIISEWFFRVWAVGFRNKGVRNRLKWLPQLHVWTQEGNQYRNLVASAFNVFRRNYV